MKPIEVNQEQFDYLKTIKPHFCFPAYGGMISESFFMSFLKLINLFNYSGINYSVDTMVNESLVPRARNSLVAKMMQLETRSTHLVFIDVDIEFDPESVIKLLVARKDVVGGIYPKKSLPIDYVVNPIKNAKLDNTLLEVKRIGTGFMCIRREVLEKMFENYPHLKYNDNIGLDEKFAPFKYALFDTSIDREENNNYLSEDYTFCDRWRAIGGKIWADLSIPLTHVGFYKFKGMSPLLHAAQQRIKIEEEQAKNKPVQEEVAKNKPVEEEVETKSLESDDVQDNPPVIGH